MSNLNNFGALCVRSLVEKDWKVVNSWREQPGQLVSSNESVLTIASKLKHCQLTVIVDENDIPLSYISAAFFKNFVYIGLYITDPNHQGQGIGSQLWKSVTSKFGDKNVSLKSRPVMTEKYRRISNFIFTSTVTCDRYIGFVNQEVLQNVLRETDTSYVLSSLINETTVEKIIQFDSNLRGECTESFLTVWLNLCRSTPSNTYPTIFTVYAVNNADELVGYGSIVFNGNGRRICPLIADNYQIFLLLFQELINHKFKESFGDSDEITMDIPSANNHAVEFAIKANLELKVKLDRSFTKKVLDFQYNKIYCFAGHSGVPE